MTTSASSGPSVQRRPCGLQLNGGGGGGGERSAVTGSSVDRLLADIAFQRDRERERLRSAGRGRRRRRVDKILGATTAGGMEALSASGVDGDDDDDDGDDYEAASAYWWTDLFLRHFVFDDDRGTKSTTAVADSDDLLFFVRRRRDKRKSKRRIGLSPKQRRRVAYDTRVYRKQQQRQPTLLPIGDPAVLWRHTVCLNAIVHRLRYTLTVAVCAWVPRKSAATGSTADHYHHHQHHQHHHHRHRGNNYHCDPETGEQYELFDDGDDDNEDGCDHREYDLQLLSRHVHTVYASTSGRRMDAAKGPRERLVYPAVCWAADDYAEAFRTVVVHPGQTVCTELVAVWPSSVAVEDNADDGVEIDYNQDNDDYLCHRKPVNIQQKQNRAVLFAGAIPYAAVRATYECKMSLYREAERQRRKQRRNQHKRGKKSSLCAALSASLTALITGGGKDSAAQGCSSDYGDYDYNDYGSGATGTERVEYVTVRGCRPLGRWDDGDGKCVLSSDDENFNCNGMDFDDVCSVNAGAVACGGTKGLAQMAVALAAVQPPVTETTCAGHREDVNGECPRRQYYAGAGAEDDDGANAEVNFGYGCYDDVDDRYRQLHQQQTDYASSPYAGTATASEPGDFYDYGWDYETATAAGGSGQQTPQTPSHQKQQLDRQRLRGGRPRRLSDPCSTSLFDLIDGDQQQYQQLPYNTTTRVYGVGRNHRKQQQNNNYYGHQQPSEYSGIAAAVATPGRTQHPHRAWSESDGLDQYGGSGWSYGGYGVPVKQQRKQHKQPLLVPPPPVPYYCAAEAAASGFIQYVRKSPGGWWTRRKNRQQRRRTKSKKTAASQQRKNATAKTTKNQRRRRSTSAGGNANHSSCCSTTDDECNSINDSDSCSDSADEGGGDSTSDDQDSDGEFIGVLAAAAAVGTDPYREWSLQRSSGDPVADWERCDSDSDSVVTVDNYDDDDDDLVEWTNEIVATDMRHKRLFQNGCLSSRLPENDYNFCVKPPPQIPAPSVAAHRNPKHQYQNINITSSQKYRRRRQPQFRPQPLEMPPPPPALSVAFTVVACPWWTVLEDVLLVTKTTTSDSLPSSNKSIMGLPLLTFD